MTERRTHATSMLRGAGYADGGQVDAKPSLMGELKDAATTFGKTFREGILDGDMDKASDTLYRHQVKKGILKPDGSPQDDGRPLLRGKPMKDGERK